MGNGPLASDPRNAIPVYLAPATPYNTAANTAGHQVDVGKGVFSGLTINTAGVGSTATVYDGTSTAGSKIGTFSTTAQGGVAANYAYTTGLFIVLAGGTPADVTVGFRPGD